MLQPSEILLNSAQLKKLYDRLVTSMARQYGLSCNEVNVLLFLANHPGCDTAKAISELRCISKSNVSRAVDSLTRQGFLTSCEDEKDRRILHLSIQPAAASLITDAQITQEKYLSCIYDGFTAEECRVLNHLLSKVADNIQNALNEEIKE